MRHVNLKEKNDNNSNKHHNIIFDNNKNIDQKEIPLIQNEKGSQ